MMKKIFLGKKLFLFLGEYLTSSVMWKKVALLWKMSVLISNAFFCLEMCSLILKGVQFGLKSAMFSTNLAKTIKALWS